MDDVREQIREYYSKVTVEQGGEMATHTCSCSSSLPAHVQSVLDELPEGITSRFYGCGSPLPPALEGCTVLDLGCGCGRDVFVASKLVGPQGKVIGIDMNADQLAVAEEHHAEMAEKWGYDNVEFRQGYIEDLEGIDDESIDVVISNCVINLSPMKERVFSEVWRVLKVGGELYFSDIFADRRVPQEVYDNPLLRGECLGGAMYIEDFRRMMAEIGWKNLRYMSLSGATIDNPEIERKLRGVRFANATVRAIKLPDLVEDICEKYGQTVTYLGGIEGMEDAFVLDRKHTYKRGETKVACGNPAALLGHSRYGAYFAVVGDQSQHLGACCGGVLKGVDLDNPCDTSDGSCCGGSSDCCGGSGSSNASSCCGGQAKKSSSCCDSGSGSGSSCCGGDSNCCSDGANNDDPNTAEKEIVRIDCLFLDLSICDRCQGTDTRVEMAIEQLRDVMDMAGYRFEMNTELILNNELAIKHKFLSSPTVRVNGVDICPEVIENPCGCCKDLSDYDVYCRQFEFNGKLYEVPPTAYVVKRILEIVFGGEKPKDEPYEIPENIKGFLDGRAAKEAAGKKESGSCCGGSGCC